MIRIFHATAFALALLLTHDLSAQDKSQSPEKAASPWAVDRSLDRFAAGRTSAGAQVPLDTSELGTDARQRGAHLPAAGA